MHLRCWRSMMKTIRFQVDNDRFAISLKVRNGLNCRVEIDKDGDKREGKP